MTEIIFKNRITQEAPNIIIHSVLPNSIQLLVEIGAMLGENIIHMVECL